jgi:hypothetical protein
VGCGKSTEQGLKTFIARALAGDVIKMVASCDRIAQILAARGDTRPRGQRLAAALGILANPAQALALLLSAQDGTGPDAKDTEGTGSQGTDAEDESTWDAGAEGAGRPAGKTPPSWGRTTCTRPRTTPTTPLSRTGPSRCPARAARAPARCPRERRRS